jgi:cyclomaltodextrinase / maltogenic alpha-amylase / neopullulanase
MPIVTPAWVRDAVFYQVFPDRFARSGRVHVPGPLEAWDAPPTFHGFKGGDLYGIADHLDHIVDLGATALYLNPVFASASNHRYHTYDYYAVDPLLGGDAALRELIDRSHERGIRVVLDGVFNHASRGFWQFNHVMECGLDSPYVDWFRVDRERLAAGRTLEAFPLRDLPALDHADSPWLTRDGTWSFRELGYEAWWDLPALPKLNTDNPEVREFIYGVAEHWIRFGADGWRLDVPDEIDDDDFWREFRRRVKAVNPDAYIVAEIWSMRPEVLHGDMYDSLMNYPLGAAALSFAGAGRIDRAVADTHAGVGAFVHDDDGPTFARRLADVIAAYPLEIAAGQLNLIDSHDTPRAISICGGDAASMRLAFLVQMTVPGAPCIYYGDEIGLPGGFDPDCRRSFPWDRPGAWDRDLLAYVSAATRMRHEHPVLREGSFRIAGAEGSCVAWIRVDGDAAILVALNNGDAPATLVVDVPELAGRTLDPIRLPGDAAGDPLDVGTGRVPVPIPARSGRVLSL